MSGVKLSPTMPRRPETLMIGSDAKGSLKEPRGLRRAQSSRVGRRVESQMSNASTLQYTGSVSVRGSRKASLPLFAGRVLRHNCRSDADISRGLIRTMPTAVSFDLDATLAQLDAALSGKKISPEAARSMRTWLTEPRYAEYAPEVARQIAAGMWKPLDDVFWTVIPFGTGGRRGKMYPIGSNAINDRTIGESAQGLADYVRSQFPKSDNLSCAIAYDTRHQSRHFAELCSEIMAAAGFKVWFLDGFRSTPELSFAVRFKQCCVRHHGHGKPQPTERQCRQSLLVDRRASAPAA